MLRALKLLPDAQLVIIGSGPERRRLTKQAGALGVADRVQFLGDIDQKRLSRYYGAADALLHTSTSEGIPNVLLEAMACGTPVVATDVGGVAEVVKGLPAGLLIHCHDPVAVATAIRELQAVNVDRGAVREYAKRFSWSRTADQHFQVLHDAVAQYASMAPSADVVTSDS
jgi:glycosyltransferase involved in cell wall biosynthesis